MMENKYLVRPDDKMVFERTEEGLYRPTNSPTDREGNPPIPYEHFTFDNLTKLGFFPIPDDQFEYYQRLCDQHYEKLKLNFEAQTNS